DLENIDAPAAPINDYVWVLALAGLIFIFLKLKAAQSNKNQFINLPVLENPKINQFKLKKIGLWNSQKDNTKNISVESSKFFNQFLIGKTTSCEKKNS
ncbi:MAG: hypothetical protein C0412_16895, partial [Flavobacterium sp.]|nr:hypothetical protein [Flavobacterium sp.]